MAQDNLCEKITLAISNVYFLYYVRLKDFLLVCSDFKSDSKMICFYILHLIYILISAFC